MTTRNRGGRPHQKKTYKLCLSLQGIGAHGAFSWGVLDKLIEDGRVDIEGLSATSMGAINAVIFAYAKMKGGQDAARELLAKFWHEQAKPMSWSSPLRGLPFSMMFELSETLYKHWLDAFVPFLGLQELGSFNYRSGYALLESLVDFGELYRLNTTQLAIYATNVARGIPRHFTNRQITIESVLAAACQPSLSQAVEIDREQYWDGAYCGYPILEPLMDKVSTRDVLIVSISAVERRDTPQLPLNIQQRIGEIAMHASLLSRTEALATVSKLHDAGSIKAAHKSRIDYVRVHEVRSDAIVSDRALPSFSGATQDQLIQLRDLGRLATELWLETHLDSIGVRSTVEIPQNFC